MKWNAYERPKHNPITSKDLQVWWRFHQGREGRGQEVDERDIEEEEGNCAYKKDVNIKDTSRKYFRWKKKLHQIAEFDKNVNWRRNSRRAEGKAEVSLIKILKNLKSFKGAE